MPRKFWTQTFISQQWFGNELQSKFFYLIAHLATVSCQVFFNLNDCILISESHQFQSFPPLKSQRNKPCISMEFITFLFVFRWNILYILCQCWKVQSKDIPLWLDHEKAIWKNSQCAHKGLNPSHFCHEENPNFRYGINNYL